MVWEAKMILWVYIFMAYLLWSLSYIAKLCNICGHKKPWNPRNFELHKVTNHTIWAWTSTPGNNLKIFIQWLYTFNIWEVGFVSLTGMHHIIEAPTSYVDSNQYNLIIYTYKFSSSNLNFHLWGKFYTTITQGYEHLA